MTTAASPILVTLGEEARQVASSIADTPEGAPLAPLRRGPEMSNAYGEAGELRVGAVTMSGSH